MKDRNSTIELLRFLLMLSICFLHILVHGKNLIQMRENPELVGSMWQLVALAFFFPSVCCFMFISGYYGLKLKIEKIASIFIQAFLVFHIGKILGSTLNINSEMGGGKIELLQHLIHFEPITTHVWWFLSEYVCIMFLSPLLERGIKSINKKKFSVLLVGLFLFNCVGLYITRIHTGSSLMGMLFIYLLARYMRLCTPRIPMKSSLVLWLIPVMIVVLLMITAFKIGHSEVSWCLLWYCNPLIIMSGVGLFYIFNNLPQLHSRTINWMGSHCLSIYLITEINKPIYNYWATEFETNFLWGIALVVFCVYLFMAIDTIQSFVNKLITKLVLKDIEKFIV